MINQCKVCPEIFQSRKDLKKHVRITHDGREHICAICQDAFRSKHTLVSHIETHTNIKSFKCRFDGCESTFTHKSNLKRHERIHTGEKPYSCQVCQKGFSSGSNLKQHLFVHQDCKDYKCYIPGCHRSFKFMTSMKCHLKRQHMYKYCEMMEDCVKDSVTMNEVLQRAIEQSQIEMELDLKHDCTMIGMRGKGKKQKSDDFCEYSFQGVKQVNEQSQLTPPLKKIFQVTKYPLPKSVNAERAYKDLRPKYLSDLQPYKELRPSLLLMLSLPSDVPIPDKKTGLIQGLEHFDSRLRKDANFSFIHQMVANLSIASSQGAKAFIAHIKKIQTEINPFLKQSLLIQPPQADTLIF